MRSINNERGYMAVFVALIFQVVFVFFAWVINIGLLVHDKINLQNSVDLAAYYAAGKQAEYLNLIAHSNYQIRQAYKLLGWRIRAIGSMANPGHPLLDTNNPTNLSETPVPTFPVVCIKHSWFQEAGSAEDFCKNSLQPSGSVPFPDPPQVFAPFLPINDATRQNIEILRASFGNDCDDTGLQNFKLLNSWMAAYRDDIEQRVKMINKAAELLSDSKADFQELEGGRVLDGVTATFNKNLTASNRNGVKSLEFFNSMGDQTNWLVKIATIPSAFYFDPYWSGSACRSDLSSATLRHCSQLPRNYSGNAALQPYVDACTEPPLTTDTRHSVLGFEKNPWILTYVAVSAETEGRRPFAPFGEPIVLKARAYAMPFGGRIGPWYRSEWPQGSPFSIGPRVDPLTGVRREEDGGLPSDPLDGETAVPNYSRFPGDTLGLRSKLALGSIRAAMLISVNRRLSLADWSLYLGYYDKNDPDYDPLAWKGVPAPGGGLMPDTNPPSWVRDYEVAAVTPNLFDMFYYSIEPQYYQNYVGRMNTGQYQIGARPRPDLGHRKGLQFYDGYNLLSQLPTYTLHDPRTHVYYAHKGGDLLTSWAPNQGPSKGSDFDYQFPDEIFGTCYPVGGSSGSSPSSPGFRMQGRGIPGGCAVGGRTGYSVRFINEDYLKQGNVVDAGGAGSGRISNPPDF